jgi:plastocyanin
MVRKKGSRNTGKIVSYIASVLASILVVALIVAWLPDASAGGKAGRSSGITRECAEALCSITMYGSAFIPDTLKVKPGATVVWTSEDSIPHTVTSGNFMDGADSFFDSGSSSLIARGEKFEHRFETAGSFDYFCQLHPGMTGSIIVTGEPVSGLSRLQFMLIMAAGVFGTFAVVASIRLGKKPLPSG